MELLNLLNLLQLYIKLKGRVIETGRTSQRKGAAGERELAALLTSPNLEVFAFEIRVLQHRTSATTWKNLNHNLQGELNSRGQLPGT